MKIEEADVQYWFERNPIQHVARCARVCYHSVSKGENSDAKLCDWLKNHKHASMFRHASYYFKIPTSHFNNPKLVDPWLKDDIEAYYKGSNPWIHIEFTKDAVYISINGQVLMEYSTFDTDYNYNKIWRYEISFYTMQIECPELARYTFFLQTQLSTARELNRKSPNNIAEESTRYVTQEGSIVRPHWVSKEDAEEYANKTDFDRLSHNYLASCENSFIDYVFLVSNKIPKEDARGVLPLDTTTHVVYTYTLKEWREIIDLRYYGTTGKPHPNAKITTGLIKEQLEKEAKCNL